MGGWRLLARQGYDIFWNWITHSQMLKERNVPILYLAWQGSSAIHIPEQRASAATHHNIFWCFSINTGVWLRCTHSAAASLSCVSNGWAAHLQSGQKWPEIQEINDIKLMGKNDWKTFRKSMMGNFNQWYFCPLVMKKKGHSRFPKKVELFWVSFCGFMFLY